MTITTHDELEHKFEADEIRTEEFLAWGIRRHPLKYLHVRGPDVYYRQGDSVVRHRVSPGNYPGELTTKRRRGLDTENCQEIDLKFAHEIGINDIQAFMTAAGFVREMTLIKDCHIFWYENHSVVLYDAWNVDYPVGQKRFIEVEVEKDCGLPLQEAQWLLHTESQRVRRHFLSLGNRVNRRLYEIFSGHTLKQEQ